MRVKTEGRIAIKQRIITAAIGLPLLTLFIAFSGPFLFGLLVCAVTVLGLVEFFAMSLPPERQIEKVSAMVCGGALALALTFGSASSFTGVLVLSFFLLTLYALFRFQDLDTVTGHLALVFLGLLYLPLLLGHMALLRQMMHGTEWIFLVLLIVMSGDTAAYFTGVNIGRTKLYPAVSPNKSVEGSLGGLAGSVLGAFLGRALFFEALSVGDCLLLGLALGALGQLGDLFESMLKRCFGVKDSGTLIPGHGGILDRLDSLIFAFPAAYYYALLVF